MPWFQRDWDHATTLALSCLETSMPWFQRDWDRQSCSSDHTPMGNIDALISKGLRRSFSILSDILPSRNIDALISKGLRLQAQCLFPEVPVKHRCPDFKGIETLLARRFAAEHLETSMPWFQRDWDVMRLINPSSPPGNIDALISKGLRRRPLVLNQRTECRNIDALISKGLRLYRRNATTNHSFETSMPWFQRDWDVLASCCMRDNRPKHRCPDFKGIETC